MISREQKKIRTDDPASVTTLMRSRRFLIKALLAISLLAVGAYVFFYYNLSAYFLDKERAVAFIKAYRHDELIFIALQILQVVLAPIPGEATGIIGGYIYGPLLGTLYSTIGLTIGSWLAFVIARTFGLPLVERVVKTETLQKYDYVIEHKGAFLAFLLFLIPGFPKDLLCYILGLSHIRTWRFLVISTVGRLLGTALLSLSGSLARTNQYGALLMLIAAGGVLVLIGCLCREKCIAMFKKTR
jgi:uncharacterized membrane protein YdjX (TVP38/TMEM64 family)